jgi:hypothetical protein
MDRRRDTIRSDSIVFIGAMASKQLAIDGWSRLPLTDPPAGRPEHFLAGRLERQGKRLIIRDHDRLRHRVPRSVPLGI